MQFLLAHQPAKLTRASTQVCQLDASHAGIAQLKGPPVRRADEHGQMFGQGWHVTDQKYFAARSVRSQSLEKRCCGSVVREFVKQRHVIPDLQRLRDNLSGLTSAHQRTAQDIGHPDIQFRQRRSRDARFFPAFTSQFTLRVVRGDIGSCGVANKVELDQLRISRGSVMCPVMALAATV